MNVTLSKENPASAVAKILCPRPRKSLFQDIRSQAGGGQAARKEPEALAHAPAHTSLDSPHPLGSDSASSIQQGCDPLPSNPDSPSCLGSPFSPSPLPSKAQAPPHPTQGRQEVSLRAVVLSSCKGSPGLGHRHGRGLGRGFRHIRSDDHEGLLRDKASKGGRCQENRRPGSQGQQVQGMNRAGAA